MLGSGEVHVWRFPLECSRRQLRLAASLLSPDEAERVSHFRFEHLRKQATAARGVLRALLGRYLECEPAEVAFVYGPQGKPSLAESSLRFNLAHSGGLALCALTLNTPVGVDLERIRTDIDHAGIARQSFSPRERADLERLAPSLALTGFFRCWTLKEAYIKGRGGGLSIPLDSFDVPLGQAVTSQAIVSRELDPEAHGWFARELSVGGDFAAAVAVHAANWRAIDRGEFLFD